MNYKDKEVGESKKHESSESKRFEKKENQGKVVDAADKKKAERKLREKA